jgi:hypothetical protein
MGGYPAREHETVGFNAFYPVPVWASLHPDRSVLPDLEGASIRMPTRFIELAGVINTGIPVRRAQDRDALTSGA